MSTSSSRGLREVLDAKLLYGVMMLTTQKEGKISSLETCNGWKTMVARTWGFNLCSYKLEMF
ncbi:unnamed protein product [Prunus armeniaca]